MDGAAHTLLESALDLGERDRADLAARLLASLDVDQDEPRDVEQVWAEEVNHRARNVINGTSTTVDWADIRGRLDHRVEG